MLSIIHSGDVRVLQKLVDMAQYHRQRAPAALQERAAVARREMFEYGAEHDLALAYFKRLLDTQLPAGAALLEQQPQLVNAEEGATKEQDQLSPASRPAFVTFAASAPHQQQSQGKQTAEGTAAAEGEDYQPPLTSRPTLQAVVLLSQPLRERAHEEERYAQQLQTGRISTPLPVHYSQVKT